MARLHIETAGRYTAGRAVVAEITEAQQIAAATEVGFSPAVAALVFSGRLTLNRALSEGRRRGLIELPDTGAGRAANLIK